MNGELTPVFRDPSVTHPVASPELSFQPNQTTGIDSLHHFWRMVLKRKKWILACILVCIALAIMISIIMKPVYSSTSLIELNKNNGGMDFGLDSESAQTMLSGDDPLLTQIQTETTVLESDSLALDVIQRLNLEKDDLFAPGARQARKLASEQGLPLEKAPKRRTHVLLVFSKHLKISPVRGTRLIRVSFEDYDPVRASQISNALVESYKNQYLQSHYTETSEASNWLTGQLSDLKANVEESERKLTDFEKQNGILGLDVITPVGGKDQSTGRGEIHSPIVQKLDAVNQELTEAEANRIEKEAIYRFAKAGNAEALAGIVNDPIALQSHSAVLTQDGGLSSLNSLLQKIGEMRLDLANASTKYGENNRHLKLIQSQIQEMEGQLKTEIARIAKIAESDYELAKRTEAGLKAQFDAQQAAANKLNEKAVQFAVLSQEAFSRKKLYEDLYTKLQEANVAAGLKATNITVIDPARSESVPVRPKLLLNSLIGFIVGIVFGLGGAFVWEGLDRAITLPAQVEEITGRQVVGVLPSFDSPTNIYRSRGLVRRAPEALPTAADETVWMLSRPQSALAEACRSLRTSIMLSKAGGGPSVVLITSCIAGEGKTTLTANLGIAYAQHNKRVLLVEADMRRPRMRHILGVQDGQGLSNVLTGSAKLSDVTVRDVRVPGLDVLPSGPHPPLPSEILGSQEFNSLLTELRSRYDLVLIDSPPALIVTDALIMSTRSDAVLWLVRAGALTKPLVSRARAMVERHQLPLIGFVVNGVDITSADYQYEYYGHRGGEGYYVEG